ncbi:MAG: trypsin-like peptidase domain-containing protein [Firmicutes bacterium]|nr:trypsin-like peptidase domain-containing protein [Bacillota bacterium]
MDELKNFDEQAEEKINESPEPTVVTNETPLSENTADAADTANGSAQETMAEYAMGEESAEEIFKKEKAMEEFKQKRAAFRKTAALGLTGAILFGVSIGTSMGISYNSSRNLFLKSAQPFDFETQTAEISGQATAASSLDITPTNDSVIDVINKVKNSVVNISITARAQGFFGESYESDGAGSGIIYSQDDEKVYIVTNNHVIEDADEVSISITGEETVKASLVGRDASSDLAVIYVLKSDLKAAGINEVTPAVFGDSDSVQAGEYVVAIGNALGEGKTTTRGIISAENKTINVDGKHLEMIQTDAAINPGNSGGALVNSAGQVIGINTAKYSSYSIEGTGFAIPVNIAKETITQLVETGSVDKPYLGIVGYTIDEEFKERYSVDVDGAFITAVDEGGAADKAGLRRSDIITAIDGVKVKSVEELSNEIKKHKSGDTVTLSVVRNGIEEMEVKATLKNYNDEF